jgi:ABC-2 type transport system ATP-binding protein
MIQIEHIIKNFGNLPVLGGLTLTVPKGEITCLLGASGAGKTTLIRIIMGALRPDEGRVTIDGTPMPNLAMLGRIGFMPQDDALYNNLTALENLRFYAGLHHVPKAEFATRAEALLRLVDLEKDARRLVANFSGGMRKRLSLAVMAIAEPDIMLLDEPTVGLDPVLRRSIWNQFHAWRDAGKTLLVSTHVMDEVDFCDRAVLLRDGQVNAYDTIENLRRLSLDGRIEQLFFRKEATE